MLEWLAKAAVVASVSAVWVLSWISAGIALTVAERFAAASLAFTGWALPFVLVWLVRSFVAR